MSKLAEKKNVINHGKCNPSREVKAFEPGREGLEYHKGMPNGCEEPRDGRQDRKLIR